MNCYSLAMYIKDHNLINKAFRKISTPLYLFFHPPMYFLYKENANFNFKHRMCKGRVKVVHPI